MCAQYIPIEQAVEMRNEYITTDAPLLKAKGDKDQYVATDFAWVKLEDMKTFIETLEKIQELNKTEVTGVRMYFSAYPNKSTFESTNIPIDYRMRESIFLVPTIKVPSTPLSLKFECLENLPFCIEPTEALNPMNGNLVIIKELLNRCDNQPDEDSPPKTEYTSTVMDTLQLVPPPETVPPPPDTNE